MRRARRHRNGKHAASWKSAAFAGVAAAASPGFGARDAEASVICDLGAAWGEDVSSFRRARVLDALCEDLGLPRTSFRQEA